MESPPGVTLGSSIGSPAHRQAWSCASTASCGLAAPPSAATSAGGRERLHPAPGASFPAPLEGATTGALVAERCLSIEPTLTEIQSSLDLIACRTAWAP